MPETDKLTIVMSGPVRPGYEGEVAAIAPDARVLLAKTTEELERLAEDADIVASTRLSPEALGRATRLKWVQSWAAGPDEILHDAMRASPVVLTSCKGNGAVPLAEHAIMMMLALDRDLRRAMKAQDAHEWDRFSHGELNGKTIGIIGTGYSGVDLALKAKAFHMTVLGLRRRPLPAENFDRMFTRDTLHELLSLSDFVVVTAALTDETRNMLGEAEFRAMKPTAFYVNYSRGAIADPDALARALKEGWIAGAGLDAHAEEPLPADSPFWDMPNVYVTPHHGAVCPGTRNRGYDIFLENLRRYLAGEDLINVVDKTQGY